MKRLGPADADRRGEPAGVVGAARGCRACRGRRCLVDPHRDRLLRVAAVGPPRLAQDGRPLRVGSQRSRVTALRRGLAAVGELHCDGADVPRRGPGRARERVRDRGRSLRTRRQRECRDQADQDPPGTHRHVRGRPRCIRTVRLRSAPLARASVRSAMPASASRRPWSPLSDELGSAGATSGLIAGTEILIGT